jgi:hypothetical protein
MTENEVLSVSCEHSTHVTSADSESQGNANDANLTEDLFGGSNMARKILITYLKLGMR